MQRMLPMKVWITEFIDDDEPNILLGPYIKADTFEEASNIGLIYGLGVLAEVQELVHKPEKERVIH